MAVRLSVTALRDFHFCGAFYRLKRVVKVKPDQPEGHQLAAGKILHNCYYYARANPVMKEGDWRVSWELTGSFSPERAMNMFWAMWNDDITGLQGDELDHYMLLIKDRTPWERVRFGKGLTKALKADSQAALRSAWGTAYSEQLRDSLALTLPGEIVEFEREINYQLGGIEMLGFADIILRREDGTEHYVDIKTGWNAPSPQKLAWDVQQNCYYLDGPSEISILHFRTATLYSVARNVALLEGLNRSAPAVADAIEAGFFVPNPGEQCGSCEFRLACLGS